MFLTWQFINNLKAEDLHPVVFVVLCILGIFSLAPLICVNISYFSIISGSCFCSSDTVRYLDSHDKDCYLKLGYSKNKRIILSLIDITQNTIYLIIPSYSLLLLVGLAINWNLFIVSIYYWDIVISFYLLCNFVPIVAAILYLPSKICMNINEQISKKFETLKTIVIDW